MLFIPILFIVTLLSGAFYLFGSVPSFLAWVSVILGGFAVVSRGLAWLTGAAQNGIAILRASGPEAVRMNLIMEAGIWGLAILNIYFFYTS